MTKKRGLGRGLESLLGDVSKNSAVSINAPLNMASDLKYIELEKIQAGKYQPRRHFSEDSLNDLAQSIRVQGVIQPIILRTIGDERYEIVAGERRFRAAKQAGLTTIPVILKELPDEAAIAMALIENIQREDLNPIEEALSLQRLLEEFEMTHEQVANAVGKSRTAVSNLIRLLALGGEVRELLEMGHLQMGHARALLSLSESQQLATSKTIIIKELSVRETEDLIRRLQNLQKADHTKKTIDPSIHEIQQHISKSLNAKVLVQHTATGRGKLVIKYKNEEELRALREKFS